MATTARTALRRMGNSTGMIVPKVVLAELGAREGQALDIRVEQGRLVAAPAGALGDGVLISAEDARELDALGRELQAAAVRMAMRLDEAIAALRSANDPQRDERTRQRVLAEIEADPELIELGALFG
jgi:antitoxin MazE